jgi:hypothetical protein
MKKKNRATDHNPSMKMTDSVKKRISAENILSPSQYKLNVKVDVRIIHIL